jgi:hypothetical protein
MRFQAPAIESAPAAFHAYNNWGNYQMAKFNIRQPFAVHLEKFVDNVEPNGTKTRRRLAQSFFPGQEVELTEDEALAHLHKLEPADAASTKFFKAYHDNQAQMIAARQPQEDGPSIDERIAAAVDERIADAVARAVEAALAKRDAAGKGGK